MSSTDNTNIIGFLFERDGVLSLKPKVGRRGMVGAGVSTVAPPFGLVVDVLRVIENWDNSPPIGLSLKTTETWANNPPATSLKTTENWN